MDIGEELPKWVMILVLVIIGIFLFIFLLDSITKAGIARTMVCGALYWIPFGSMYQHLIGGCGAVPV
jgi:hypothetical protein